MAVRNLIGPETTAPNSVHPSPSSSHRSGEKRRKIHAVEERDAEAERLRALRALGLLDTPPEPEFDDLAQLAAVLCDSPVSMISLVDQDRQWFKASIGLTGVRDTPRDVAFCHYTIQQPDLMVVEDATLDPRFDHNPMVTGAPGWRFYAGVPLTTSDGHNVGALCVLDRVPRSLSKPQETALRVLADQVNARLELRAQRLALEQALEDAQVAKACAESLERRFQVFMDAGPFLAYMKDPDGRLIYYNERMAQHFAVSREALLNKCDAELWPPSLAAAYREHDLEVLNTGQHRVTTEETSNPDGSVSVWRSYKFPCAEADGRLLLGGVSIEVTEELRRERELRRYQAELEEANRRLQDLAAHDALTGLPNRRCFDETLRKLFRHARGVNAPLSLLMLDVDRFKLHNDRFGHAHGDDVLRLLANHLKEQLRADDFVARFGGEEFVVLLPATDEEGATCLAERLVQTVRSLKWPVAPVTISIGLSTLSPATPDARRLLTLADEALYAAKCGGRDRMVCYSEVFKQTLAEARRSLEASRQTSTEPK